ncbi:MAG TPA: copper resistance protein NlpE N-terminal domain-containing protein [Anaerolineae bacterium]|nr:copper resistance protein NlpE N-terminal domain-containing protein [Anaerolineae bacterium]
MRRTIPLIVLIFGILVLAACTAAGLPTPEEPVAPAPTAETPAEPAAVQLPDEFVGVYTASLPAADSPGRDVTVALETDGSVVVTSDYLNDQPPIVETGFWSANPSGAVTVVLTAQDGQQYFEPRAYLVGLEADELLVTGEAGQVVRFARSTGEPAAEPVAAAPSSEEAPAAAVTETITTTAVVTDVTIAETLVVTATDVLTEEVRLVNTYLALLPAASGGGTRLIALTLFDSGTAQLATEFTRDEAPILDLGSWVDNGDDTITVTFTGRPDQDFDEPIVVTFQREQDFLQSIDREDLYGSEGLRLRLAADVARAVSASLVTVDLEAGFPLDPTFVSVQAGGEVDASLLSGQCAGFINQQPVVTVNWSGSAPFVETFFISDSDPTLVVLTPDGQLLCNDDANPDVLDPVIEISEPVTGTYRIWVGSYAKNQLIPGVLVLTTRPEVNIGTFNLGGLIQRPLVPEVQPKPKTAGTRDAATAAIRELQAEAVAVTGADPVNASLTVSGTIPLFELDLPNPLCNGLVSGVPDFVFDWTGEGQQFAVFFEGDNDATLLVLSEDGEQLTCGDDVEPGANLNPLVVVAEPKPGLYGVWVGRLDPSQPVAGILTITTVADAAPKTLAPRQ